jgi:hypothetical protein
MRTVMMMSRGAMAAMFVAAVATGCAGQEASGAERAEIPGLPVVATQAPVVGELSPGDQRTPDAPTVIRAPPRWPIGKALSPAVTTTSTRPPPTPTAAPTTTTTVTLVPVGP